MQVSWVCAKLLTILHTRGNMGQATQDEVEMKDILFYNNCILYCILPIPSISVDCNLTAMDTNRQTDGWTDGQTERLRYVLTVQSDRPHDL